MFKLSTTNTHEPAGSMDTVCSIWLTKSPSVRVGPIVGRSNSPVVTTKLPIRHKVPCRVYSNSINSALPRDHRQAGGVPLQRLQAGHLVHTDGVGPWIRSKLGRRTGTSHRPP